MAYKVSYKVVSEQGDQLKNIAKDVDNYVSQMNGIISKLGNDELLQSIRSDLSKFVKQLEEEKTVLNLAGQVITEVVQSYTGAEKKSVQKVDRAKAHNRDFYKRPVSVPSAGGSAGTAAGAAASAATNVNINVTSASVTSFQNTTNIMGSSNAGFGAASATVASGLASSAGKAVASAGAGISGAAAAGIAAAAGLAAAGGAAAGAMAAEKQKEADGEN